MACGFNEESLLAAGQVTSDEGRALHNMYVQYGLFGRLSAVLFLLVVPWVCTRAIRPKQVDSIAFHPM